MKEKIDINQQILYLVLRESAIFFLMIPQDRENLQSLLSSRLGLYLPFFYFLLIHREKGKEKTNTNKTSLVQRMD